MTAGTPAPPLRFEASVNLHSRLRIFHAETAVASRAWQRLPLAFRRTARPHNTGKHQVQVVDSILYTAYYTA